MMNIAFNTNNGVVNCTIDDPKLEDFVKRASRCRSSYGSHPEHPIDYCQIAYQLKLEGYISEEDYLYYYNGMSELFERFD